MIAIDVHKTFTENGVTQELHFELEIRKGELVTIFGDSGVGKTSLLRMISGLLEPDSGHIQFFDKEQYDSVQKINISPQERSVGLVFQDYALFPHMTVLENMQFAATSDVETREIQPLLEIMELEAFKDRKPEALSGGQQQRVALARALVQKPQILLLDEPLSALNQEMRIKLQDYLLEVHCKYDLTTILVSHDKEEVIKMSDRVFVLEAGEVSQFGSPIEVFGKANRKEWNYLEGRVIRVEPAKAIDNVLVLVGNQMVYATYSEQNLQGLKEGDLVKVEVKG
ncbi:ABC transporter ATP-binding protein [bacterium SCSIO 12643]|nr:ABC transporter ATP-binding protein [bacterium SCSIO 12643]